MIRNILILYQDLSGRDFLQWFRTYSEALDFSKAESFHPWMACFDRIQLTGELRKLFEKGQRKGRGK